MKKYPFLFLFATLTFSVKAQFDAEKTPLVTRSLATDAIKNVLAETSGGSITVTGVAASEAKIEVYVIPNNYRQNRLTEAEIRQRMADDYKLTLEVGSDNKLTVIARPVDKNMNWKKALNFSFKIWIPNNISAKLATSGGSINLTHLSGNLDFATSGGSLHLDDVSGKIDGRTSGGSIHVENSKDDIDLSTSGGSITARKCDGKLRLSTSGGSINLGDLKGDVKATTSGGSVNGNDIEGDLAAHTSGGSIVLKNMSCNLSAGTSGGGVHVELKELKKSVALSNSGGNIDLIIPAGKGVDLELTGNRIKTDKLENFTGKIEEDKISGKLNGGGTSVTVKGGGGRVYLGFAKN
jgi:DUF4097 and DUF4098 domain-containing protein YvlB